MTLLRSYIALVVTHLFLALLVLTMIYVGPNDAAFVGGSISLSKITLLEGKIIIYPYPEIHHRALNSAINDRSDRLVLVLFPSFFSLITGLPLHFLAQSPFLLILFFISVLYFSLSLTKKFIGRAVLKFSMLSAIMTTMIMGQFTYNTNHQTYGFIFLFIFLATLTNLFFKNSKESYSNVILLVMLTFGAVSSYYTASMYIFVILLITVTIYRLNRWVRSLIPIFLLIIFFEHFRLAILRATKWVTNVGPQGIPEALSRTLRGTQTLEASLSGMPSIFSYINMLYIILLCLPIAILLLKKVLAGEICKKFDTILIAIIIAPLFDALSYIVIGGFIHIRGVYLLYPSVAIISLHTLINSLNVQSKQKVKGKITNGIIALYIVMLLICSSSYLVSNALYSWQGLKLYSLYSYSDSNIFIHLLANEDKLTIITDIFNAGPLMYYAVEAVTPDHLNILIFKENELDMLKEGHTNWCLKYCIDMIIIGKNMINKPFHIGWRPLPPLGNEFIESVDTKLAKVFIGGSLNIYITNKE